MAMELDVNDSATEERSAVRSGGSASLGQVDTSFYLIGVGASAGGLEAIRTLISQIPDDYPHSLVFIQHISPDYKSLMGELLRRETSLTVCEVQDDMEVKPGHVYVIPPKANIIIQGTDPTPRRQDFDEERALEEGGPVRGDDVGLRFSLIDRAPHPQLNLPIDLFFQSLAEAVGDRSVAVILSGTGSDGSRGLRSIKDADGLVVAQDPETAGFDGMPRAAVATRIVDLVLPPDEIVGELHRYFELRQTGIVNIEALFSRSGETLRELLELAGEDAQIDFSQYKEPTLKRRIARRMGIQKCSTVEEYLALCKNDPNEIAVLCRGFLVGVTHFFRDLPAWEVLKAEVLPDLFGTDDTGDPLKIWCVGCSTGEEAYTIAMILETYRRENGLSREFRVFATDVNEAAISIAKDGIFPEDALEDIPEVYAREYTTYMRGGIRIKEGIRKKVIFSAHNASEVPPYIHTDLLICRNMLIYLNPAVQAQLLSMFSYSLRANRYLFLGVSESIDRGTVRFHPVSSRWRIFRNVAKASSREFTTNATAAMFAQPIRPTRRSGATASAGGFGVVGDVFKSTLEHLDTCVIVVDERMQVIETFGDYRRHLCMPDERFSSNILDLVPQRLTSALALLIRKAQRESSAHQTAIRIPDGDVVLQIEAHARRMLWDGSSVAYAITLRNLGETPLVKEESEGPASSGDPQLIQEQSRYLVELETELEATRATLEAAVEDLGVSNEELQTSNEELMSTNEELQATNEEIQSVNEELHTVNAEHAEKITELETAYADIENLLENADLATVFLDDRLRIRRFSSAIKTHFQLDRNDIGRPLSHFSSSLEAEANRHLLADAELALNTGDSKTYEVSSINGSWYLARIRPFTSTAGERVGVVMTFVDITRLKALQFEVQMRRDLLESLLEGEAAGYWETDLATGQEFLSPRFQRMFGYTADDTEDCLVSWREVLHPDDRAMEAEALNAHISSKGAEPYDVELRCLNRDGDVVWVWRRGRVVEWSPDGRPIRMIGCHFDITHLKSREREIIRRAKEIRRFTFISAHDLREPMNTVEGFIRLLREELGADLDADKLQIMDHITETGRRMRAQIESMLEYAKLQDETLELQPIDMKALTQTCISDLSRAIEDAGAQIHLGELTPALGSPMLISRVVVNILSNAVKFRRPKVAPRISVTSRAHRGGYTAYVITDNGIGIEPQFREQVFEIFTRLHIRTEYEGTGLGLALSQKIISKHGGSIWIEDGEEGGSAFVFTLKNGAQA
ncbi:MAG: chemotaxis protein CheB [Pseudomonadota bacterium]